jgi:hypothetical protein
MVVVFTPLGGGVVEGKGFIEQAIDDSDPYYYNLLRQASAQEGTPAPLSPPPPTLPFTPFSLQQQQEQDAAIPEEEGIGNDTGTTTTTPGTNDTGGAVTELTPSSSSTEPPLRVEAIANATEAYTGVTIRFDASITGGAPPYSYSWSVPYLGVVIDQDRSITQMFFEPGTFGYTLTVTDSRGKTVTDGIQIVIFELPSPGGEGGGLPIAPEPGGVAPPEGGGAGVPLAVEIIPNSTQVLAPAAIEFDSEVTGGIEPYNYRWELLGGRLTPEYFGAQIVLIFPVPGMYTLILNVTDSNGRTGSDSVQITVGGLEPPPEATGEVVSPPNGGGREGGVLPPPETGQEGQLPGGGGLLPGIAPGEEGEEGGTSPSITEEEPSPLTNETRGGE